MLKLLLVSHRKWKANPQKRRDFVNIISLECYVMVVYLRCESFRQRQTLECHLVEFVTMYEVVMLRTPPTEIV